MNPVVLLGPRGGGLTLRGVVAELEASGVISRGSRIAAVTAGWRDREANEGLLDPRLADRVADLELYRRSDRVAEADAEFARAHRATQGRLKALRRAYNLRLDGLVEAHRGLAELRGDESVLRAERDEALEAIRRLDARHLDRVVEIRSEFERRMKPAERDAVRSQRREVDARLEGTEAVVIEGGHVANLLSRLRLFGGRELLQGRAVIARSAGAMVLTPRIVLFHDRPPWGAGHPEVFDAGLGLAEDIVALPHASSRLALDDRALSARLAARFAPASCVLLDPGHRIDRAAEGWNGEGGVERLDPTGRRVRFPAAA
ncbi:Type 1 glutamine amidotransferase-like domain-containing protein [Candidatus Palauibacter sp.]|uniref:Type 1 glutamine amidotransferase-like domain-containing protein n=1 Tax=Candidatus Palauibacter sp. TaxID=3101350 RepID=UPI003CC562A1